MALCSIQRQLRQVTVLQSFGVYNTDNITQNLAHSIIDAIIQCKMKNLYNIGGKQWRSTKKRS